VENKIFITLVKEYFSLLWKYIFLIFILVFIGNIFLVSQPLIFSAMLEEILSSNNLLTSQSSEIQAKPNFFDLNFIGKEILFLIKNNLLIDNFSTLKVLTILSVIFFLFLCFASLFEYLATLISKWSSSLVIVFLRKKIIDHLFKINYIFFNQNKSGEVLSRLINDSKNVAQGIVPLIQSFLHQGSLIIIYSFFLIKTDYQIFLLSILIFSLQYLFYHKLSGPINRSFLDYSNKSASLMSKLNTILNSIKLIKFLQSEKNESELIFKELENERSSFFKSSSYSALLTPFGTILTGISSLIIIFLVFYKIDSKVLSYQAGIMYIVIGRIMINPIIRFSTVFSWTQSMSGSYYNIQKILEKEIEKDGKITIKDFNESIEFINVSFSYNKKLIINSATFNILKNETIAIVGKSGSGKSTCIDLLYRLYKPSAGIIRLDGRNIDEYKLENYRLLFSIAPQETILYRDTILENIRSANQSIKFNDINKLCEDYFVNEFSSEKSLVSFKVGERGNNLSGGEKQRVALIRTLVNSAPILIFDESTSALDNRTKTKIIDNIIRNFSHKTKIIITHELNTVSKVNKVIFINEGIIIQGTHKELLSNKSYKEILENNN